MPSVDETRGRGCAKGCPSIAVEQVVDLVRVLLDVLEEGLEPAFQVLVVEGCKFVGFSLMTSSSTKSKVCTTSKVFRLFIF